MTRSTIGTSKNDTPTETTNLLGSVVIWSPSTGRPEQTVWGLPTWWRLIRQLKKLDITPIWLVGPVPDAVQTAAARAGVVTSRPEEGGTDARPGLLLVADASWVLDERVLAELAARTHPTLAIRRSHDSVEIAGAAVIRCDQLPPVAPQVGWDANTLMPLLDRGDADALELDAMPTYRLQLRRHITPFAVLVDGAEPQRVASTHVLDAAQKGTNDLPAQLLHPPLENRLVRLLVPLGLTPNMATVATIVVGLAVAALFAVGQFVVGLLGAIAVGVLDGVDGKIARVTLNATQAGDVFEHIADNVYEILWYLGIGSGLVAMTGDPFYHQAAWVMTAVYLLDRGALGVWKLFRAGDFHESSPWDQAFRRVCGRRNNIVFLMLPFFLAGRPDVGFLTALAWWAVTFVVHAIRVARALFLGLGDGSSPRAS